MIDLKIEQPCRRGAQREASKAIQVSRDMEDNHSQYSAGELGHLFVLISVRKGPGTKIQSLGRQSRPCAEAKPYEIGNLHMALVSSGPTQKTE